MATNGESMESVKEQLRAPAAMKLVVYDVFYVVIDNRLQLEECAVKFEHECGRPARFVVTYAVPQDGLEFDPRDHVGKDREFEVAVICSSGEMLRARCRVVGFSAGHGKGGPGQGLKSQDVDRQDGIARIAVAFEQVPSGEREVE